MASRTNEALATPRRNRRRLHSYRDQDRRVGEGSHGGRQERPDQSVEYLAALLEKIRDDGGFSLMRLTRLMRLYDCPFDDADFTEPGRLRMCSREVGARLLATAAQEVPRIMSGIPPVRQRQELGRTLAANWVPLDVAAAVRTISAGAGDASGCASVGIEGPWDDAVSVSILAGDLIDRARRPGSFANYRLIMAFETADEAATDSPEAMAEHIEKTIMGTIPASASPARREARLEVTTPHVVLRAGTDEELTLVRQAIALVLTRVRRYVTFVVLVDRPLTTPSMSVSPRRTAGSIETTSSSRPPFRRHDQSARSRPRLRPDRRRPVAGRLRRPADGRRSRRPARRPGVPRRPRTAVGGTGRPRRRRPLLLRGLPGTGKSSVASFVAERLGWRYYELAMTSETTAVELLWRYDAVRRLADAQTAGTRPRSATDHRHARHDDHDSAELPAWNYVEPGPLWWAQSPRTAARRGAPDDRSPRVAAVDLGPDNPGRSLPRRRGAHRRDRQGRTERAERASRPARLALLRGRATGQLISMDVAPEGRPHRTLVIITTNEERELPRAFVRRCVVHTMPIPGAGRLVEIAEAHDRSANRPMDLEDRAMCLRLAKRVEKIQEELRHVGQRPPERPSSSTRGARLVTSDRQRIIPTGSSSSS